jgi:glycosyltransferase involved in cell wall biosynthesis
MRYVFLTACRNEEGILEEFLREFEEVVRGAGIADRLVLYVVDDLSIDRTVEILEEQRARLGFPLEIIRAPTNFGNQGALFHALSLIEVKPEDVLVTFDCDGEDDVRQIPSIIALSAENPGKLVLIERGQRSESLMFKIAFSCYKLLFRYLTRQKVIPNNFMLVPGRYVPVVQKSPLAAVHFAYAILKTRFPSVVTKRDRRARYGGKSSQNLFMVASHGLVGLMVFYEIVIAELLFLLTLMGLFSLGVTAAALTIGRDLALQRILLWVSVAMAGMGAGFFCLLLASALALIFKLTVFTLSRVAIDAWPERVLKPPPEPGVPRVAVPEASGKKAS